MSSEGELFNKIINAKIIPKNYSKYDPATGENVGRAFIDIDLIKQILDEAAKEFPKSPWGLSDIVTIDFWFKKWFGESKGAKP